MSGILSGLGLSQRWDIRTNTPAAANLFLYAAGTATPVIAYKNAGLTAGQEHPNPIPTDSFGIIPAFWLADGDYRARLVSSDAAVIFFDVDNMTAVGASSGGGGSDTTDPNSTLGTGDYLWVPKSGTRAGWVRSNARTIGSATSGASERANADCQNLFSELWNNYSNTLCPVASGRGISAAADWSANKAIGTLDLRGRSPFGLSDMGNTDAATFSGVTFSVGNGTTAASMAGAALVTLLQTNLPNVSLDTLLNSGTVTMTKDFSKFASLAGGAGGAQFLQQGSGSIGLNVSGVLADLTGITSTLSGGVPQTNVNKMPPAALGTWFIRL